MFDFLAEEQASICGGSHLKRREFLQVGALGVKVMDGGIPIESFLLQKLISWLWYHSHTGRNVALLFALFFRLHLYSVKLNRSGVRRPLVGSR